MSPLDVLFTVFDYPGGLKAPTEEIKKMARFLVENGFDINKGLHPRVSNLAGMNNKPPIVAFRDNPEIIQMLLDLGANPRFAEHYIVTQDAAAARYGDTSNIIRDFPQRYRDLINRAIILQELREGQK